MSDVLDKALAAYRSQLIRELRTFLCNVRGADCGAQYWPQSVVVQEARKDIDALCAKLDDIKQIGREKVEQFNAS